jgi:quinate/shikimate dehydrogenase (NAD+)
MPSSERPAILVGLIGSGIQASLSPAMHEREGSRRGFKYLYRLIDLDLLKLGVEALPDLLTAAQRMGFRGVNVTHPCKQVVIPYLDDLSSDAQAIGAVNTVVFGGSGRSGRIGHNTDCSGFGRSFQQALAGNKRERVVQLGAGGAGAAAAYAALKLDAKQVVLFDIDRVKAEALSRSLCSAFGGDRARAGEDLAAEMARADGLIHATPTGMEKHPGLPLPAELLRPTHWVAEIVYFPLQTELLRVARTVGCKTMDGSGMAVFQAAGAFRLFTGVEADAAAMLRDFEELAQP